MRTLAFMAVMGLVLAACAPARSSRAVARPRPAPDRPPTEVARARPPESLPPASRPAATRADSGPLTAKIDGTTPASRSAALRLTEEGRRQIATNPARAIELLERAVTVDARVPYAYYFLAEAHAQAGQPALAFRFLDRAEQKLASEPYWMSETYRLRGTLLAAAGKDADAERAYRRALEAWPGNRAAAQALTAAGGHGKERPLGND
jgi:tetratricopeptide (TPR) repeat protein